MVFNVFSISFLSVFHRRSICFPPVSICVSLVLGRWWSLVVVGGRWWSLVVVGGRWWSSVVVGGRWTGGASGGRACVPTWSPCRGGTVPGDVCEFVFSMFISFCKNI